MTRLLALGLLGAALAVPVPGPDGRASAQGSGQASARQQAINDALTALAKAPDEQFAGALESRIRAQWLEQASVAVLGVRGSGGGLASTIGLANKS